MYSPLWSQTRDEAEDDLELLPYPDPRSIAQAVLEFIVVLELCLSLLSVGITNVDLTSFPVDLKYPHRWME